MIVDMKKVYLLCLQKDSEEALSKLADLGVLHITSTPDDDDEATALNLISLEDAKHVLAALTPYRSKGDDGVGSHQSGRCGALGKLPGCVLSGQFL